jgi:ANTAR domain/GAF domain
LTKGSAQSPFSASLSAVTTLFAELGQELRSPASVPAVASASAFEALARTAVRRIEGARAASITTLRSGQFQTVAATDDRAMVADTIQYELGSGPCVDAVRENTVYRPVDLRTDPRWPRYGPRVSTQVGFTSMMSYRLHTELAAGDLIAGLNIYADKPHAFDDTAAEMGLLLATHGSLAIAAEFNRDRVENLERALRTSRDIGVAMGVLMSQHKITREQAFDLLRIVSQSSNRKLHHVAELVAATGCLPWEGAARCVP